MDAVTEVLLDRSHQADRLNQMMAVSLAAHVVALALVALAPRFWPDEIRQDEHVMTISLAGAVGPIQGINPAAAKAVQQAVPDPAKARNDAPPALTKPEMVEPVAVKKPEPKPVTKPEPQKIEPQLHSRTPTQGAEVRQGSARVDTGQTAPIPFGGLATGGAGMGAARTELGDFCCPEYLQTMQRLIYANWKPNQGQLGANVAKFVVRRDGTITDITIDTSAGPFLDLASQRALQQTQRLPPLPAAYPGDRLTVLLDFKYR
jgi:outer membrane biosynthesis protein TonB